MSDYKPRPKPIRRKQIVKAIELPPADFVRIFASLITTALAVCCGIAWNTTVQTIFKVVLGNPDNVTAQLTYAVIITLVSIVVILYIVRLATKISGEEVKPVI